jgi:prevent-host-death family protein
MKTILKGNTVPISEARAELPEIVERVRKLHNKYFITKRGKVEAVIMSAEELESWRETLDILSNKAEIKALKRAERQMKKGKGKTFEEVFGEPL